MEKLYNHTLHGYKTVVYLSRASLHCNHPSRKKKLDDQTEALVIPDSPPLQAYLAGLSQYPYLSCTNAKPTAYVDVSFFFVFWSGLQGPNAYSLWYGVVPKPSIGEGYL